MCGACGILRGGVDWTEPVEAGSGSVLAQRQRRGALVNRVLALSGTRLAEHGRQQFVRSATGRTRMVADLAHVWAAADMLGARRVDPLDDAFLASLEGD